ncbi:hypothetical protein V5O48_015648 [Marasmius crinis-equi]|uniref:DUF6535 domain-containing protein n=1 Tax=Marasmius crinis-equi TaxID=585013 RepID=A0ABR3ETX7_9AGAR
MSDEPENSHQATEETHREMIGSASRLDSDAQDEGARKTTELDTSAKGMGDVHHDQHESIGPNSNASPSAVSVTLNLLVFGTFPTIDQYGQNQEVENSWGVLMKEVTKIDDAQYKDWDDDINTLLVFAGLFSAVVTAFTIESYQWLSPNPQDTSVALLTQIFQQMRNETMTPISPESFKASSSVVRINTFWFLSLVISLVDALFGLLCKQWLREHRRPTHTRTPQEALALHWLRHESLERWHVSTFLATLPMLLELALFFFFAGLLELLWSCHFIPFIIAMIVVGVAAFFYIGTTIMPGVNIIRQAWQVTDDLRDAHAGKSYSSPVKLISSLPPMEFICPYKSPQAWVVFKAAQAIAYIWHAITHSIVEFLNYRNILQFSWYDEVYCPSWEARDAAKEMLNNLTGWPSVDLELIQRSTAKLVPPFYELKAFRWLVQELQDSPSMIPHLQNTLGTLPLHLVMPAVFDQWFFHPQRDWTMADIGTALQQDIQWDGIEAHKTFYQRRWLDNVTCQSTVFQQLLHYNHILVNWREAELKKADWDHLVEAWEKIWKEAKSTRFASYIGLPFSLHTLDEILNNPEHTESGLKLFQLCTDQSLHPQWFTHYYPLAHNLAQHIIATSTPHCRTYRSPVVTNSPFVRSPTCLALIQQIHSNCLEHDGIPSDYEEEASHWLEATDIIQHIHNLPPDHFPPLPNHFPIPLTKLEAILWALPDEPSDSDFEFLRSSLEHWPKVAGDERAHFIGILSKYINEYPSYQGSHGKHSTDAPLVMHRKGLEFIGFLYVQWRKPVPDNWEDRYDHQQIWHIEDGVWTRALDCVQAANQWPPDMFKAMFTPIPDFDSESPLTNDPPLQIQGGNTIMGTHAGAGDKDSVDTGHPDGAGLQSHKEMKQAMEWSAKESEDSGVCHTSQGDDSVGGIGADDNV